MDEKAWKDWLEQEDKQMIKDVFSKIKFSMEEAKGSFRIDKTGKRKEYDGHEGVYPGGENFQLPE